MKKRSGILMSFALLLGFVVIGAVAINGWDVDKVRPDVQHQSAMVVMSEGVDNTAFNAEVDDETGGSMGESLPDVSMEEYNNASFKPVEGTRVISEIYKEYLEILWGKVVENLRGHESEVYAAIYYLGHTLEQDTGIIMLDQDYMLEKFGSLDEYGGYETQWALMSAAVDLYETDNKAYIADESSRQSLLYTYTKKASSSGIGEKTWGEVKELIEAGRSVNIKLAELPVWEYYNSTMNGVNSRYRELCDAIGGQPYRFCAGMKLTFRNDVINYEKLTLNKYTDSSGELPYYPSVKVSELEKLFDTKLLCKNRSSEHAASQTMECGESYAKVKYDGYSQLIIIVAPVKGKTLAEVLGQPSATNVYNLFARMRPDTAWQEEAGDSDLGDVISKAITERGADNIIIQDGLVAAK